MTGEHGADGVKTVHLHLVSDSTGETVQSLARACIVQFSHIEAEEHHWTLIRTAARIDDVLGNIEKQPGLVLFTLMDADIAARLMAGCRRLRLPCLPVMEPFINAFAAWLDQPVRGQPGRQHMMDAEYFSRIEAVQFALAHDDGQGLWNLANADVVITGVSRTSKTPTCVYLANRGVKAANVPFVPDIGLPDELLSLTARDGPLVVGLTKDPGQLVQVRKNRLRMLSSDERTDYVDPDQVRREVAACRRLCSERNWPVIDVSRRSIEETAAAINQQLEKRQQHDAKRD